VIAPAALFQLVRADFLERVRRHSFLVTLGFTLYAAFMFLPPNHARYATLNLGGHRGVYNSAWVGTLVAMMAVTFLSMAGFYLVKNAVERDRHTGVGAILAATPLPAPLYLLGKMLSNFSVLATMVALLAVAAGIMQLVRGEDSHLHLLALVGPFVLVTLPIMGLVAALAVFFEVTPGLRGGLGNIVYFVIWMTNMSLSAATRHGDAREVISVSMVVRQMQAACTAAFPDYPAGSGFAMGFNIKNHGVWDMKTFVWEGVHWTPEMLAWRAFWAAVPFALTLVAALLFDRFDAGRTSTGRIGRTHTVPGSHRGDARDPRTARGSAGTPEREPGAAPSGHPDPERVRPPGPSPAPARAAGHGPVPRALTLLAAHGARSRFGALVLAELRIGLKGVTRWWSLVALALVVASLFVPLAAVRQFLAPFAMIWPILRWSPMGTREIQHRTDALLFSSPRPVARLVAAQWLAGWIVALAVTAGATTRFALTAQWGSLAALMAGAAFAPAMALAFGTWSGSAKLFEVVYLLLWYGGPMNRIPAIDFVGTTQPAAGPGAPIIFLALAAGLMGLAILGRRRQLRR
jgi:hypothetical protein